MLHGRDLADRFATIVVCIVKKINCLLFQWLMVFADTWSKSMWYYHYCIRKIRAERENVLPVLCLDDVNSLTLSVELRITFLNRARE